MERGRQRAIDLGHYITENGCAASDVVTADGHVYDSDRLMYLRNAMVCNSGPRPKGFR